MTPFGSDDRARIEGLRAALPRTWPALFARFGRLLEIQVKALPPLLEGRNAVLASATASGKTEAAVAPLAERSAPGGGLQIAYVVPTRALCNDLERRLAAPLASIGLPVAVRTGERPELAASDALVLTTPESLDSLLCRTPRLFAPLRGVILDELHVLDGTYRGDQLRILLRRLERAAGRIPQYAALSATLADPAQMARRYFADPVEVRAASMRGLRFDVARDLGAAIALVMAERRRKVLVFCNRRRDVEQAAQTAARAWPQGRVAVHHASLARRVRERAEASMREWPFGMCIATTTLEVGLDIGELDAVILLGAPPTAAAFQQRVGRACRREDTIRAVGCAADPEEAALLSAYADLARRGEVEPRDYEPDPSVAVQQIFSSLYAAPGGVPEAELGALLGPLCPPGALAEIEEHLEREGYIARAGGRLRATARTMDLADRGLVHSNIPDSREWRVVDAAGRALGTILTSAGPGDRFYLGGRAYVVERAAKGVLHVRPAPGDARTPVFRTRERGAFTRFLPRAPG